VTWHRRLTRDRRATFGAFVILTLAVIALLAPWLAPAER
jgi:ABC-type antimicrobial peptide transport system permease subunit